MAADQSYPIGLRNNLLTQEHYEIIGGAIWVYMWVYDRITEEYLAAGETRGRVLGGEGTPPAAEERAPASGWPICGKS